MSGINEVKDEIGSVNSGFQNDQKHLKSFFPRAKW